MEDALVGSILTCLRVHTVILEEFKDFTLETPGGYYHEHQKKEPINLRLVYKKYKGIYQTIGTPFINLDDLKFLEDKTISIYYNQILLHSMFLYLNK